MKNLDLEKGREKANVEREIKKTEIMVHTPQK